MNPSGDVIWLQLCSFVGLQRGEENVILHKSQNKDANYRVNVCLRQRSSLWFSSCNLTVSVCVSLADMKTLLYTLVFIVLNVSPSVLQASRVSTYIPKCIYVHVHPLKRSFSWPRTRSVDVVLQRPSSGSEPKLKSTEGDAALQLVTTCFTADEQTSWNLKTSMWCTETNISWERFCKITDRFELNVLQVCSGWIISVLMLFWFGSDTRTTQSGSENILVWIELPLFVVSIAKGDDPTSSVVLWP